MKSKNTTIDFMPQWRLTKSIVLQSIFFVACFFATGIAKAQPQYSVGSTTSGSNVIPFGTGTYNSYRCQMLYLPSDFGAVPSGMAISKIYFVPSSSGAATFTDMRIDIGQSNITSLTSSAWQSSLTTALNVGSYTVTAVANQWWEIELATPIPYDPTKSLIVDVRKNGSTRNMGLRNQSGSPGNKRAYGPYTNSSPSGASTTRYTFGFSLVALAPDNAGVGSLTSPVQVCAGTHPIKVELKNSGTNPLKSVTIDWELDATPQTTINWSGNLASGASTEITLHNGVSFGAAARSIKAWTLNPNGVADTVNSDDTLNVMAGAGLAGVYTVGTGKDFPTVKAAADALNAYGVCGPVTMNIDNGTYSDPVVLNNIYGANSTNRITFQSANNNASGVVVQATPVGDSYVMHLSNASYITIKDITITSLGNNAGHVLEFSGGSSEDSVLNCVLNASTTSTSSSTAGIYASGLTGSDNVLIGNTINRGYYGIYWIGTSTSSSGLTKNHIFEENTIKDAYVYSTYFYYTSNLKFRYNEISAINSPTTHYGVFAYYSDNQLEVIGNKIAITGSGTKYGMRFYYNDGSSTSNMGYMVNNTVAINSGNSTAYGIYAYYSRYQNFVNNSINVVSSSASSQSARFYYSNSTSYSNNTIRNNVFSNKGTGLAAYIYYIGNNNSYDYNNLYTSGTNLVQRGSPSGTFKTIADWRTASSNDMNSISYDPGFTSDMNLEPDPTNNASWSLNGRGVHLPGNAIDINGSNRVLNRADGVPDIGAYEFDPVVDPPLATAVPATADPGDMQEFYFGGNLVAKVSWSNSLKITSQLDVRQYSGRKGPSFNYNDYMYFYTNIKALSSSNTYAFDFELSYMDIWLGNMPSENTIKLAHQFNSNNWTGYNGVKSNTNGATNNMSTTFLNAFGNFTGTTDGEIFSAYISVFGSTIICNGDNVQLFANTGTGYDYQWKRNGVNISGANQSTYLATLPGDYTVVIKKGTSIAESIPVSVSTIAAPNSIIVPSSNPTYCTGSNLTLSTQQGTGLTYQWQLDGNNIPGANSVNYQVQAPGNYTVVVENIGCAATSPVQPVTSGPLTVDLGNDIKVCANTGSPIVLDAGYPGAKYTWSNGATTQKITVTKTGTYSVTVDAGPNCMDQDVISVQIDPLPSANGISYVKNGNSYFFSPSNPVNVDGVMWIFSDGTTSTQKQLTKVIDGDLYVRLVLYNTCGTDTIQLGYALNVDDVISENSVTVYPNPAKDNITIDVNGGVDVIDDLTVINNIGVVVYKEQNINGKQKHTIDVSALPKGYYMLRVRVGDATITKAFTVMK
ncbi:MAG: T9SS type A sorting domain-containing protein [Chitinophagales bacterium]|nr:T9SS type A sorting domain-containing protein [Chitinophagaceae bacterium]MCB9063750.1 T9SS type A sorting domain-containing protein [Chitinophagales bacterium]